MTARDRSIILVLGVAAVIGGFWFMAFKPRRAEVQRLDQQIAMAQQARDTAVQTASAARSAQRGYGQDRATIARLGKAVPTDDDTASLIYQLDSAAGSSKVNFESLLLGGAGGTAAAPAAAVAPADATQAAVAELPPGATVGTAGLSKLSFSLTFSGDYFGLEKFLNRMHSFTSVKGERIGVHGRLMAVDGISLVAGPNGFPQVTANLTASAFLSPTAPSAPAPVAGGSAGGSGSGSPSVPTTAAAIGVGG